MSAVQIEPVDEPFPYALARCGVIMEPEPGSDHEAEGVLNPGSARGPDGELYLFPRLVAAGNVSRVGLARIVVVNGEPHAVQREGVVLTPDRWFERGPAHAGVEDPRITWIGALGRYVMAYVAYGALGPRVALAVSTDLRQWQRLGPVTYGYDDDLGVDLNLLHNKDVAFFAEPVTAPDGQPSLAVIHRPMGYLGQLDPETGDRSGAPLPADRPGIWISFVPLAAAQADLRALTHWGGHRLVAEPEHPYEELKIGGGPPPLRVPEGWLLLHHGVTGELAPGTAQQQRVHYAAGGMILDGDRPWKVITRSATPLLEPDLAAERVGIVPNVVFPTAIEEIDGVHFVFYGMADSRIGAARLLRRTP